MMMLFVVRIASCACVFALPYVDAASESNVYNFNSKVVQIVLTIMNAASEFSVYNLNSKVVQVVFTTVLCS